MSSNVLAGFPSRCRPLISMCDNFIGSRVRAWRHVALVVFGEVGKRGRGGPQVNLARLRAEEVVNPIGGIAPSKPDYQPPTPASVRLNGPLTGWRGPEG